MSGRSKRKARYQIDLFDILRFQEIGPIRFGDPYLYVKAICDRDEDFRRTRFPGSESLDYAHFGSERIDGLCFRFQGTCEADARFFHLYIEPPLKRQRGRTSDGVFKVDWHGIYSYMPMSDFRRIVEPHFELRLTKRHQTWRGEKSLIVGSCFEALFENNEFDLDAVGDAAAAQEADELHDLLCLNFDLNVGVPL